MAEARSLSAQARLSAVVVGAAPLGYLAFSALVDPAAVTALVDTGVGRVCLVLGLGLEALAGLWIRRILALGGMSSPMAPSWLLGLAWGMLLALPIVRRARRVAPAARIAALGAAVRPGAAPSRVRGGDPGHGDANARGPSDVCSEPCTRAGGPGSTTTPWRGRCRSSLDLLGVAVGAGCTPYLAVEVAAHWSPAMVAAPLAGVLRSCALGMGFASALDAAARATPALRPLAEALLASDRLGAPVAPILARLADEERTALRRRAEAHARRIPVRLLFPLVFLVLPAFVLLTVVPGLASGLGRL